MSKIQKCFQGWQRKNRGSTRTLQDRTWLMRDMFLEVVVGLIVLLIMEGKISGVKARGRPRRAWTDDLKDLTELRNYSKLKRTAQIRTIWNALARQEKDTRRRNYYRKTKYRKLKLAQSFS